MSLPNVTTKSKLHAKTNSEKMKLRGFLLPFGPETFVFQFDTKNMKTEIHINIRKYT